MSEEPGLEDPAAPLLLTRELHEYLLEVLVRRFGEALQVEEAQDPENGLISYRFEAAGAICTAAFAPHTARSAVLSFSARLGRLRSRYRKALRWLGYNRSFNTVAVAFREEFLRAGDLWISSNRNTLCGDQDGIGLELEDFCLEVEKAMNGLKRWFPEMLEASKLAQLEESSGGDEMLALALAHPRQCLAQLDESPEARDGLPTLYCQLSRWLGEWEKNLFMLESEPIARAVVDQPEWQKNLRGARLRALMALGRYQQVLGEALPALQPDDLTPGLRAAVQAECELALDQVEEALETLQSAELDHEPWVHYLRSTAAMRLGRRHEAAGHFAAYESMVGADLLAREKVSEIAKAVAGDGTDDSFFGGDDD